MVWHCFQFCLDQNQCAIATRNEKGIGRWLKILRSSEIICYWFRRTSCALLLPFNCFLLLFLSYLVIFCNGFAWPITEQWTPPMKAKINPYQRWQTTAACMISLISWFLKFDCLGVSSPSIFNSNGKWSIANPFVVACFGGPLVSFLLGFGLLKHYEQHSKWSLSNLHDLGDNKEPAMSSTLYCWTRIGFSVSPLLKAWYDFTLGLCWCIMSRSLLNGCIVSVPMINRLHTKHTKAWYLLCPLLVRIADVCAFLIDPSISISGSFTSSCLISLFPDITCWLLICDSFVSVDCAAFFCCFHSVPLNVVVMLYSK